VSPSSDDNGRPPEQILFVFDGKRLSLRADDDNPRDELRAIRERIRKLAEPIHIISKEEDS
jgi:hypothetical protein